MLHLQATTLIPPLSIYLFTQQREELACDYTPLFEEYDIHRRARGEAKLGYRASRVPLLTKAGMSAEKMGSKKNISRRRAQARKKNLRRAIGLKRGRAAALRRTGYIPSKPGSFMGVYSMNIHRKLKKLQTLIPGGRSMQKVDVLFKETAEYIVSLKMQVCLLQALSNLCSSSA